MSESNLLALPQELLGHVCACLSPGDIIRLGQTCRLALDFTASTNLTLWRDAFLREFDDPHERWNALLPSAKNDDPVRRKEWDWYGELRRRLMVLRVLDGFSSDDTDPNDDQIAEVILDIVDTATVSLMDEASLPNQQPDVTSEATLNLAKLCPKSRYSALLERFIDDYHSSVQDTEQSPVPAGQRYYTRSEARRLQPYRSDAVARLHVLYGITQRELLENRNRGAARRLTYDWQLTGPLSDFGPFKLDGSGHVNWQLLEAVSSVIGRNIKRCIAGFLGVPQTLRHSLPYRTLPDPSVPHDWARVTGTWVGTYSFLDYSELFRYNVGFAPGPRPDLEDELEACGDLMRLELQLDHSDEVKNDWRLRSELPVCEDLPVLYFSGTSRGYSGLQRPLINVRGRASLVPGAREVRWRYLISYGGADQWQLEGVQAGGIRSGSVFGLWSHCDHEEHGPVGPFCYFPLELCDTVPRDE